jgi:RNA polymerase sigma-70 factor (ECF subfamily)
LAPEIEYDRRWALALIARVIDRLAEEQKQAGNAELFERLREFLPGGEGQASYVEVGSESGLSECAVKVKVHRLRERCRALLREEVAHTVTRAEDVEEELRYLVGLFSR